MNITKFLFVKILFVWPLSIVTLGLMSYMVIMRPANPLEGNASKPNVVIGLYNCNDIPKQNMLKVYLP
jgi:hypothetical protein